MSWEKPRFSSGPYAGDQLMFGFLKGPDMTENQRGTVKIEGTYNPHQLNGSQGRLSGMKKTEQRRLRDKEKLI